MERAVGILEKEIAVYERMRGFLEREYHKQWVVIYGEELAGTYADFQDAAADAALRFGRGPYLIRQVGVPAPAPPPPNRFRRLDSAGYESQLSQEL